ncbi:MAG: aminotransferase class IV family protein [Moraxella sp.]|nr:aminotransferase class IV family protein [Moraxella sp.]
MYPLFETIAIKDGKPCNIGYHQERYKRSLMAWYGSDFCVIDLAKFIAQHPMPTDLTNLPLVRCRLDYNNRTQTVQYFAYTPRSIRHFAPVVCDDIDYRLKYSDRTQLDSLRHDHARDDGEIMIVKHGFITDCSIGNLVFRRHGEWFTPATPLLHGTQRQYLLDNARISLRDIRPHELELFEDIRLINALNGLP